MAELYGWTPKQVLELTLPEILTLLNVRPTGGKLITLPYHTWRKLYGDARGLGGSG